jgi:hypothetical protein
MRNQKSKSAFALNPEILGLAVKGPTLNVSDEEKKFYGIDTWVEIHSF